MLCSRCASASGASSCSDTTHSRSQPRRSRCSPSTLINEARETLRHLQDDHHTEAESTLLPEAERAIVTYCHPRAYSAARCAGVSRVLLDMYECAATPPCSARTSAQASASRAQSSVRGKLPRSTPPHRTSRSLSRKPLTVYGLVLVGCHRDEWYILLFLQ